MKKDTYQRELECLVEAESAEAIQRAWEATRPGDVDDWNADDWECRVEGFGVVGTGISRHKGKALGFALLEMGELVLAAARRGP